MITMNTLLLVSALVAVSVSLVEASDSEVSRQLTATVCGDGQCEGEESCETCPDDCGCVKTRQLAGFPQYSSCSHNGQICTSNDDCNTIGTGVDTGTCVGNRSNTCKSDGDCPPFRRNGNKRPGKCKLSAKNTCRPQNTPPSFSFIGVGDTPYNQYEACMAHQEVVRLNPNADHSFFFHLGDIRNGQLDDNGNPTSYCDEQYFEGIASIWRGVPFPTFFVIGDNGWLDCPEPRGYKKTGSLPAPERAYELWKQHLFFFYEQGKPKLPPGTQVLRGTKKDGGLGYTPARTQARLSEDRSGLFSFYLEENKALVIGTVTPGAGREESRWNTRIAMRRLEKDNGRWIEYNVQKYSPSVVIILSHTMTSVTNYRVLRSLEKQAKQLPAVPFLVLMDEHCFEDVLASPNTPNVFRLKLDDTTTPTEISVDLSKYDPDDMSKVFSYDRGCYCHTDHKPTRKICWGGSGASRQCHKKCSSMEKICGRKDAGPFSEKVWDGCGCPSGAECCSRGDNVCSWRNTCSF